MFGLGRLSRGSDPWWGGGLYVWQVLCTCEVGDVWDLKRLLGPALYVNPSHTGPAGSV